MLLFLSLRIALKVHRAQEKISVLQRDKYGLSTETNTIGHTVLPSLSQVNGPENYGSTCFTVYAFFLSQTPGKIVPEQKNAGLCVTAHKFT